jgi:hypothetical protein
MSADGWTLPVEAPPLAESAPVVDGAATPRWKFAVVGLALSFVFHAWLLGSLAGIDVFRRDGWIVVPIDAAISNEVEPILEPVEPKFELADPQDRELPQRKTINAASIGVVQDDAPSTGAMVASLPIAAPLPPGIGPMIASLPSGVLVDQRFVVPGTTGEGLVQLDGALDRVTWEIAQQLKERRVLVVWLLDASGSLERQRAAIAKRLKRIYGELQALEQESEFAKQDRPILTGVVGFGLEANFLTREPTDKFDEIQRAFQTLPNDPSGVENVFTAVSQVMDRWHKYRTEQGRRILLVTVTDEAGDDHGTPLDFAIAKCRRWGALAYVIGPAAPFGKRRGYYPYRAPEDGQTYQIPIDLGPESVVVENVDLPFWYSGPQYGNLSSGFGPYALSRLVKETGGVYFLTSMTTMAGLATVGAYDRNLMKAYEPDYGYGSQQDFLRDMARYPVRMAVFAAAQYSQTTQLRAAGTPQLEFRLASNNFKQAFTDAQKSAAITQLAVDNIFSQINPAAEKAYAAEPSLRWRLAFSLNYGRLLAQKVRALEYNTALAELKTKYTASDVSNRVNRVSLQPDRELNYVPSLRKSAKLAEEHLQRVVAEAPGTPWAILAARELRDGFGIRVVEEYVPPPPPQPKNARPQEKPKRPRFAPEPKKNAPTGPPAPKPKPVLPKL